MGQDQPAGVGLGERQQVDARVVSSELGECARDQPHVDLADDLGVLAGDVQPGAPKQPHAVAVGGFLRREPEVVEDGQDLVAGMVVS